MKKLKDTQLLPIITLTLLVTFFHFAISFSYYSTVYLQDNGFLASDIGIMNSVSSVVAIFAMMFWGFFSDKINSIKKTLLVLLIFGTIMYSVVPLLPITAKYSVILMMLYFPFINFFRSPINTLVDNITVRSCAQSNINFGKIRAIGSFTFALGSLLIVYLLTKVTIEDTFFLSGAVMLPAIIFLFLIKDPKNSIEKSSDNTKKAKVSIKPLFKSSHYICFLIFAALLYIPLTSEFSFITYFMKDNNISTSDFGALLATRALMEIPMLILVGKLRKKFKLKHLIVVSCCLMAAECLLIGFFATKLIHIIIFYAIFGIGNGIYLGSVSVYIYKLAPNNLKASAHTIFASVFSVSGILGNFIGGFMYQALGGRTFYVILGIAMLVSIAFFGVSFIFSKNIVNPADQLD